MGGRRARARDADQALGRGGLAGGAGSVAEGLGSLERATAVDRGRRGCGRRGRCRSLVRPRASAERDPSQPHLPALADVSLPGRRRPEGPEA